jgi:signal transduction histidine kinase
LTHNRQQTKDDGTFRLHKSVNVLQALTLGYEQSLVTFEFAALDYTNPNKNQYAYKMEGLDKNWIKTDAKNRRATYSHLASGRYILRVKASNADGVWNKMGAAIKIQVLPPPWRSWWAYSIYVILLVSLGFMAVWNRSAHNRARDQLVVNEQLKEINTLKDSFLANTSHELRTPLNGIIGLAESLIDGVAGQLPAKANKNLAMVVTSGRRLSNLVNDILDLSKLNHHSLELDLQPIDLYALTDVVLTLSQPLVANKDLMLINTVPQHSTPVAADEDRLLQIMHNLVGNAIKFTDSGSVTVGDCLKATINLMKTTYLEVAEFITEFEPAPQLLCYAAQLNQVFMNLIVNACDAIKEKQTAQGNKNLGRVNVRCYCVDNVIEITVSDNGNGMTEQTKNKLFEPFYTTKSVGEGTGLGLSISYGIVQKHGGELTVKSELGQGTEFRLRLPV